MKCVHITQASGLNDTLVMSVKSATKTPVTDGELISLGKGA